MFSASDVFIRNGTYLCNQGIKRECDVATHDMKKHSQPNSNTNRHHALMVTRVYPKFILPVCHHIHFITIIVSLEKKHKH